MPPRSAAFHVAPLLAALIAAGGCSGDSLPTPPDTTQAAEVLRRSLLVTVDLEHGTLEGALVTPGSPGALPGERPHVILGTNELGITLTNLVQSAPGQYQRGRVRVTFDVALTNRLNATTFITPTFPKPPAGQAGLLLFPFQAVTTPANLAIRPSPEWDGDGASGSGAPWNFLGNASCFWGHECYRWEAYPAPLAPQQTTSPRTVGFDIDKRATGFTAYLVLVADLQDSPPSPANGGLAGTVTSPQRGPLAGVSVNTTGATTATDGAGLYTLASLAPGAFTLALTNLPAGCTDPGSQDATVVAGGVATVNFSVTCSVAQGAAGSLHGVITGLRWLGPIANGQVKLLAAGSVDTLRFTTGPAGDYTAPNLAPGRYAVAFSGPPICRPITGTGVSVPPATSVTLDLGVDCPDGMVVGTVKAARNGAPVVNARVAFGGPLTGFDIATTDSVGHYESPVFRPGDIYPVLPEALGPCAPIGQPILVSIPEGRIATLNLEMDCAQAAVTGTVMGPTDYGPMVDRIVAVTGGPNNATFSGRTGLDGRYLVSGVTPTSLLAPYDVAISNLPAGCVLPAHGVSLPKAGQTDVVNLQVDCAGAKRSRLTVTLQDDRTFGPIIGARVFVNNGTGALEMDPPIAIVNPAYFLNPLYSDLLYTITVTNLAANCTPPAPQLVLLPFDDAAQINIRITCQ